MKDQTRGERKWYAVLVIINLIPVVLYFLIHFAAFSDDSMDIDKDQHWQQEDCHQQQEYADKLCKKAEAAAKQRCREMEAKCLHDEEEQATLMRNHQQYKEEAARQALVQMHRELPKPSLTDDEMEGVYEYHHCNAKWDCSKKDSIDAGEGSVLMQGEQAMWNHHQGGIHSNDDSINSRMSFLEGFVNKLDDKH